MASLTSKSSLFINNKKNGKWLTLFFTNLPINSIINAHDMMELHILFIALYALAFVVCDFHFKCIFLFCFFPADLRAELANLMARFKFVHAGLINPAHQNIRITFRIAPPPFHSFLQKGISH